MHEIGKVVEKYQAPDSAMKTSQSLSCLEKNYTSKWLIFWNDSFVGNSIFFEEKLGFSVFGEAGTRNRDLGQRLSICWFCIFDCAVFCDYMRHRGTVCRPSEATFLQKTNNSDWYNQNFWQKTSYEGLTWILGETRFPACFNNRAFQRQPRSKKLPLSIPIGRGSKNTLDKQTH